METQSDAPLVWIDCEMTGLNANTDTILEIACFITDHKLQLIDPKGFEAVIHHTKEALDAMSGWCVEHHGESGLTKAALRSKISPEVAAAGLLRYIKTFVPQERTAVLAGNSVHMDKEFLKKPPYSEVIEYLHYRILDVSAIKEAARRWASPTVLNGMPMKKKAHTARADILESIEEARYLSMQDHDVNDKTSQMYLEA